MLSINTNLPSLIAQKSLMNSTKLLNKAVERMSTGFKVNHASDNAANYSIVTNMNTKIGAYQVAEDNVAMGLDLVTTASESLDLMNEKLVRLRALAEQAANGTYGEQSLKAINAEANALVDEMLRTYNTTKYNGIKLLDTNTSEASSCYPAKFMKKIERISEEEAIAQGYEIIKTAEDLQNSNFSHAILMNDIDLADAEWLPKNLSGGYLDGNGYVIKNLHSTGYTVGGLFQNIEYSTIKNLGIVDCNIIAQEYGAIGRSAEGSEIDNCFTTGTLNGYAVAGIVMAMDSACPGTITNCYSECNISANTAAAGICIECAGNPIYPTANKYITNCYTTGDITAYTLLFGCAPPNISDNCYATGKINGVQQYTGALPFTLHTPTNKGNDNDSITLQVGIENSQNSQIGIKTSFALPDIANLSNIGLLDGDYLTSIDEALKIINSKQTEYGAVQNRLESALDEISTQYENIVSSRSTLRDADIAQVSSEYIRQQILQQASATLLSTANQTPALALQLL